MSELNYEVETQWENDHHDVYIWLIRDLSSDEKWLFRYDHKPGEWTPQEAPHAAFPGIYIGLEPVFKEDRQKLFAWLHWHEVKIYEQD